MNELCVSTPAAWRRWLAKNHDRESQGVWLVFYKRATGKASLEYGAAVEEALCFGWIDSLIKRLDNERYCRKFTPRRDTSIWSAANRRRVEKLTREGRMTEFGRRKVEAGRRSGRWKAGPHPAVARAMPQELADALAVDAQAREAFAKLAPSCRRQYIAWIATAKQQETRIRRVEAALVMLARGRPLGMK